MKIEQCFNVESLLTQLQIREFYASCIANMHRINLNCDQQCYKNRTRKYTSFFAGRSGPPFVNFARTAKAQRHPRIFPKMKGFEKSAQPGTATPARRGTSATSRRLSTPVFNAGRFRVGFKPTRHPSLHTACIQGIPWMQVVWREDRTHK